MAYPINYPMFSNPMSSQELMMQRMQMQRMQNTMDYPTINQPTTLPTIPVSCIEEAKAARVPLDGSITVFLDIQNNCVYTKQLNNSGIVELNIYRRETESQSKEQPIQYALLSDFELLKQKLLELEKKLNNVGGKNHVPKPINVNESTPK